jgi:hypothetical protein
MDFLEKVKELSNLIKNNPEVRKKKKKVVAKPIEEKKEFDEGLDEDKYDKIKHFAIKYRIPFIRAGGKKTYKDLVEDIYKYEKKNVKRIIQMGLDPKYKQYGLYIKVF